MKRYLYSFVQQLFQSKLRPPNGLLPPLSMHNLHKAMSHVPLEIYILRNQALTLADESDLVKGPICQLELSFLLPPHQLMYSRYVYSFSDEHLSSLRNVNDL